VLKVAIATLAFSLIAASTDARPPHGIATPEAEWFRSLAQPNGEPCCADTADGAPDCHRLDDNMVRPAGNHWEFLANRKIFGDQIGDNKWHEIPEEVLIRGRKLAALGGNIVGRWVVCAIDAYPNGHVHGLSGLLVLCAVPPTGV
jgi:hypothetical protein